MRENEPLYTDTMTIDGRTQEATVYPGGTLIANDGTLLRGVDTAMLVAERIEFLTGKIPVGTFCSETNCCGGFLTQAEVDELERLFEWQRLELSRAHFCF